MIQIRFKDGTTAIVGHDDVKVVVRAHGSVEEDSAARWYGFGDMTVFMVDPMLAVARGYWSPPGKRGDPMPIRTLKLDDTSDFSVEVPVPVEQAEALGAELQSSGIKVVQKLPSRLVLPRGAGEG